jgi:hypothetical protein
MRIPTLFEAIQAKLPPSIEVETLGYPCRPRILVVADASLSFKANSDFGLWRFLEAISVAPGVVTKPVLTLAHRGSHTPATVTIGADSYTVKENFKFSGANPAVNTSNYDQIWMFGFASGGGLPPGEIPVIADFMNSGGGVFATGDHAAIGKQMCGSLPRIRHMREWSSIPMGIENDVNTAVMRIDTVVNPGANNLYEFNDQADDIPQRIYPNYSVTAASVDQWQATLHPLLRLPGAPVIRNEADGASGFTQDIDVLPDHPHESVCYEVTGAGVLNGAYTVEGLNFEEFRPSAASPAERVGAQIVAYGVAGGRSVQLGFWKPPVRPRMFGIISAYDGRLAQPYAGKTQRPGRIVCDSTWHHFVNINLDGTTTARSGLGTWSGNVFTPSAALEKIYTYYRNIVRWLQPANRVWCGLWWSLVAAREHPRIVEELIEAPRFQSVRDFVGLGWEAAALLDEISGAGAAEEDIMGVLLGDTTTQPLADFLLGGELAGTYVRRGELLHAVLGAMLVKLAVMTPSEDSQALGRVVQDGVEKGAKVLMAEAVRVLRMALEHYTEQATKTADLLSRKVMPLLPT